ncbi:glutamate--cysteine ligase [Salinadaptatus halalkaliphilus]|uniref:Glutamate--cysteine ligase n=1 Tax=Salinadaptatus halalkaliphilus TaxID=2419781 RepID=A0A4S3TQG9_9EURY|nr:glutamate-cysteine ligase family protein [Salinadaptatus halalkaliphilus]THE66621.1 glutamate--cysteine ligase [Salinadaptatus halalkaliphilus]
MPPNESEPIRRSIEVEYWVVDEAGRLTDPGPLVDAAPGVEREFVEPVLEIKTTPCESTAQLRTELFDRLHQVLERADETGMGLVPLATPINHEEIRELESERTQIQNRAIGENFEYVRHCAGTHIHVEQQPGHVVDQLNTFIALDPALALVNSSPYFRGRRVTAGARSELYRRMAYADLEHQGQLWPYVDAVDDWDRRLEQRYEEFLTAALEAGVDRTAVEKHFDPESAVWTPVQLRAEFSTVEWRSPDATLPSQIVRVADRLATIVERLVDCEVRIEGERGVVTDDAIVLPTFDAVCDYVDAAIRDGLTPPVRSYLERMGFDVDAYEPVTAAIDGRRDVSVSAARRIRTQYADRLESDVRNGVSNIDEQFA